MYILLLTYLFTFLRVFCMCMLACLCTCADAGQTDGLVCLYVNKNLTCDAF